MLNEALDKVQRCFGTGQSKATPEVQQLVANAEKALNRQARSGLSDKLCRTTCRCQEDPVARARPGSAVPPGPADEALGSVLQRICRQVSVQRCFFD